MLLPKRKIPPHRTFYISKEKYDFLRNSLSKNCVSLSRIHAQKKINKVNSQILTVPNSTFGHSFCVLAATTTPTRSHTAQSTGQWRNLTHSTSVKDSYTFHNRSSAHPGGSAVGSAMERTTGSGLRGRLSPPRCERRNPSGAGTGGHSGSEDQVERRNAAQTQYVLLQRAADPLQLTTPRCRTVPRSAHSTRVFGFWT